MYNFTFISGVIFEALGMSNIIDLTLFSRVIVEATVMANAYNFTFISGVIVRPQALRLYTFSHSIQV